MPQALLQAKFTIASMTFERIRRKVKTRNREFMIPHELPETDVLPSRPAQWATLEELLDKLLFLAVSGDGMKDLLLPLWFC